MSENEVTGGQHRSHRLFSDMAPGVRAWRLIVKDKFRISLPVEWKKGSRYEVFPPLRAGTIGPRGICPNSCLSMYKSYYI